MAAAWVALLVTLAAAVGSVQAAVVRPYGYSAEMEGRKLGLVDTSFVLGYHNGPLLTGRVIPIYIIWYGRFTAAQKNIILDFTGSFAPSSRSARGVKTPSVGTWWSLTGSYKNRQHQGVSKSVTVGGQTVDNYSLGKNLNLAQIESLVTKSLKTFPTNTNGIYLVLTSADVQVQDFCSSGCGSHATVTVSRKKLPYAWVGNPASQCPGQCAWPFAAPTYPGAPKFTPLSAPNGDVGVDGMIITIATLYAGTATNPLNTGYYQGDPGYPLEAATACQGQFGAGSYPGYPGSLLTDAHHRSFNAYGINGREFLVPALWNPATKACKTLPR